MLVLRGALPVFPYYGRYSQPGGQVDCNRMAESSLWRGPDNFGVGVDRTFGCGWATAQTVFAIVHAIVMHSCINFGQGVGESPFLKPL